MRRTGFILFDRIGEQKAGWAVKENMPVKRTNKSNIDSTTAISTGERIPILNYIIFLIFLIFIYIHNKIGKIQQLALSHFDARLPTIENFYDWT
jgi:hypothetical protein